nr:hypothetical protein [Sedimenticola selenatireducens]
MRGHRGNNPAFLAINQLGQYLDRLVQQLDNCGRYVNRLVNDTIEQVLDRPGKFADGFCTDQPPTPLQGVKRAAEGRQRIPVILIFTPARQVLLNDRQLLFRFLDEDLKDLGIDILKRGLVG